LCFAVSEHRREWQGLVQAHFLENLNERTVFDQQHLLAASPLSLATFVIRGSRPLTMFCNFSAPPAQDPAGAAMCCAAPAPAEWSPVQYTLLKGVNRMHQDRRMRKLRPPFFCSTPATLWMQAPPHFSRRFLAKHRVSVIRREAFASGGSDMRMRILRRQFLGNEKQRERT
jgi:hypothetical protein